MSIGDRFISSTLRSIQEFTFSISDVPSPIFNFTTAPLPVWVDITEAEVHSRVIRDAATQDALTALAKRTYPHSVSTYFAWILFFVSCGFLLFPLCYCVFQKYRKKYIAFTANINRPNKRESFNTFRSWPESRATTSVDTMELRSPFYEEDPLEAIRPPPSLRSAFSRTGSRSTFTRTGKPRRVETPAPPSRRPSFMKTFLSPKQKPTTSFIKLTIIQEC